MTEDDPKPYARKWFTHVLAPQVIVSIVTTLTLGVAGFVTGVLPKPAFLDRTDAFKQLTIGNFFVPADFRVDTQERVNLDGKGPKEVIFTAVGKSDKLNRAPRTLIILAWDAVARRWTIVFDAAKDDAISPYPDKVFPKDRELLNFQLAYLPYRGGRDVIVSFNHTLGFLGANHRVVAVRFRDNIAQQRYVFDGSGEGHIGVEGDTLIVTSDWHTAVDPHCCPFRAFTMTLKPSDNGYQVASDDRVGLGITGALDDGVGLRIADVPEQSPAFGKIRPGDVVVGLAGHPITDDSGKLQLFHEIGALLPGSDVDLIVYRNGSQLTVRVKTVSRAGEPNEGPPLSYVGATFGYDQPRRNVVVQSVAADGPFANAGVSTGSILNELGGVPVHTVADIDLVLWRSYSPLQVRLVSPAGNAQTVTVQPVASLSSGHYGRSLVRL